MKFIPWKQDNWLSREGTFLPFDKLEHFLSGLLGFLFLTLFFTPLQSFAIVFVTAALWEVRDGYITGFSWKDLIAGVAGLMTGLLIFIF